MLKKQVINTKPINYILKVTNVFKFKKQIYIVINNFIVFFCFFWYNEFA